MKLILLFVVGLLVGGLLRGTTVAAQRPARLYGTTSGAPIPLQATAAGVLQVWMN